MTACLAAGDDSLSFSVLLSVAFETSGLRYLSTSGLLFAEAAQVSKSKLHVEAYKRPFLLTTDK